MFDLFLCVDLFSPMWGCLTWKNNSSSLE